MSLDNVSGFGARSSDAPARLVFVLGLGILLWGVSP